GERPVNAAIHPAGLPINTSEDEVLQRPVEFAQYTSAAFAQVCDGFGIRRSMGRVGSTYDNALAESFWQGLKRETMHQRLFSTMRQARLEIFQWLTYYNARRRHSALNYLSPAEFEQQQQRARKLTLAA
ncbi:integrase core domain-containing protein, partial [Streptomyces sp. NPDC005480]|uniref:integrase core domain-containing protein n=1 Tax=Streptomyces sp. NPDC005480 TaxID=3154880 RepID=UPI0033B0B2F3